MNSIIGLSGLKKRLMTYVLLGSKKY